MSTDERTYLQQVREEVMTLYGTFGNIERHADKGSDQAKRARRGALAALALADDLSKRLNRADVANEAAELAEGDYSLSALAAAPPATIED